MNPGNKENFRLIFQAFIIFFLTGLISSQVFAQSDPAYKSKYMGEENRIIKNFSAQDIDDLKNGRGWGLAKAAELNGVPGPIHLLEMKNEINLSSEQVDKITEIYQGMKEKAVRLGHQLLSLEEELNGRFADKTITNSSLNDLLEKIAGVRKELRYTHLETHLRTPPILTPEQITLYSKLRGYSTQKGSEVDHLHQSGKHGQ